MAERTKWLSRRRKRVSLSAILSNQLRWVSGGFKGIIPRTFLSALIPAGLSSHVSSYAADETYCDSSASRLNPEQILIYAGLLLIAFVNVLISPIKIVAVFERVSAV